MRFVGDKGSRMHCKLEVTGDGSRHYLETTGEFFDAHLDGGKGKS